LITRMQRTGSLAQGARRSRRVTNPRDVWGQLTTLGIDEAQMLGRRLQSWMLEQLPDEEASPLTTMVLSTSDVRSVITARAVLAGLGVPNGEVVSIDTSQEAVLRISHNLPPEELPPPQLSLEDAALEILEALGDHHEELDQISWPRLLDIAETAKLFGLLPRGALTEQVWPSVSAVPCGMASTLIAADGEGARRVAKLVRLTLISCIRASRGMVTEQVRISVLPGFSLLCLCRALHLEPIASIWPSPCSGVLVETLVDEKSKVFLRFWRLGDMWELRPTWQPSGDGPASLQQVLESLQRSPSLDDNIVLGDAPIL